MRRTVLQLMLLVLSMCAAGWTALADTNDTSGHLDNGGFEGGYYSIPGGQMANGWTRVNRGGNPTWQMTSVFAGGGWVEKIEGGDSMILSSDNAYDTVLHQSVSDLVPGRSYSFSGWALKMFGGSAGPQPPEDSHALSSRFGVDPLGGTDPNASSVVWSSFNYQRLRREWRNQKVAFTAQGNRATVFVQIIFAENYPGTQVIVDAMELFEAPEARLNTRSGTIRTPRLDFDGCVPETLTDRGNYQMYYKIEKFDPTDGGWDTLIDEIQLDAVDLLLVPGQTVTLRIEPYSKQPAGQPVSWPPTTHIGMRTNSITVTYAPARPDLVNTLFLPVVRQGTRQTPVPPQPGCLD